MAQTSSSNVGKSSRESFFSSLEKLRAAKFEVSEQGSGRFLISRDGCAAVLTTVVQDARGLPRFAVPPGWKQGDGIAHLVDAGFQKFWQIDSRRVPARAQELKALHGFERDLRAALGEITLYNEALGTVSSKYIYDRLEGREPGKRHQSFD